MNIRPDTDHRVQALKNQSKQVTELHRNKHLTAARANGDEGSYEETVR